MDYSATIMIRSLKNLQIKIWAEHTLSLPLIKINHEHKYNSKRKHMEQNGPCSIQESCHVWPHLYGDRRGDWNGNWCILGFIDAPYFFYTQSSSFKFFLIPFFDLVRSLVLQQGHLNKDVLINLEQGLQYLNPFLYLRWFSYHSVFNIEHLPLQIGGIVFHKNNGR